MSLTTRPERQHLVTSFIAEVGSEEQGPWMSAAPKKSLPAHKLPMNDGNSKFHCMILALGLPTGAPEELRTLFRNGVATCDGVRADDEKHEMENSQHFEVTEWIVCGEDTAEEDIVLLLPPGDNRKDSSLAPRTPRKRISTVGPTAKSNPPAAEMTDADMVVPERNVGDKYPPSVLLDYRGSFFAHDRAQLWACYNAFGPKTA
ncbi:hypothetical protein B0H13DRAFT_2300349 [Mycena leptocephala]|nr:hypothetical protein B0H13DRAFT_2300349 [Mycena leptocephala]